MSGVPLREVLILMCELEVFLSDPQGIPAG